MPKFQKKVNPEGPKPAWRNRIVGHGEEEPAKLLANPKNWRLHPKAQTDALAGVLSEVGWVQDIVVNQRSGFIVDGHARVDLAKSRGEKVPVVYVDLSDKEEALILASLDPLAAMAETNREALASLVGELEVSDAAVKAMLAELTGPGVTAGLTDEDAVPDVPAAPVTVEGDLWLLGKHRVLCGDSTSTEATARLCGGQKPDMVFTDPPYGINYQDTKKRHQKIAGDSLPSGIPELLSLQLQMDCPIFICCNWRSLPTFYSAMEGMGREPKACIVWDKLARVQNLDRFYKRHEFILYHGPFGGEPTLDADVWQCGREVSADHPTAKPVELISKALEYTSATAALCVDLFLGSGSTLIACEKTARACCGMELSPDYVDVIIRRWQEFSGKEATLDGDGRTFAQIAAERIPAQTPAAALVSAE